VSAIAAGVIAVALLVWLAPAIERSPSTISFGQTRQVTLDPGLELDPAVSPDGSLLAYSGSSGGARHIFVRTVAGGTPVEVTRDLPGDHVMPRWAPDGSQQLLVTTETGVFVVPALGGAPRLVAAGATYASWAPDSRHIVYVQAAAKETYNELMVRDLAGGDARKLAEGLDLHTPAWSPDGRLIAYVSGNSPYAYSPSGLGNLGPSAVYVISSERGKPIEVVPKQFLNTSPAWTPDSRSLLLVSTRDGGRNIYQLRLDRDGRPRGAMERLTTGLAVGTISLSADGRQLAYSVFQNLSNIWAVRIPTTGTISVRSAEQITQGNQHIEGLAVSHDGRSIAFDSDRGGNSDIYKMALNGGEPVQLTTDPHDDFYPAWSADDQWIAFHSWRNGSRDVFVVRAEGGKVERVAGDTAQEAYPDWSPDGMRLAYHSNRTGRPQIYVTERNARGEWAPARQVTWQGGTQPKWSPDGHTLLYVRPRGMGVYVTDLAGPQNDSAAARERLVLALPFMHNGEQMDLQMAAWSRDGRILLKNSVGFWDMPATGGTPHLLVRLDDPALPSRRQEFVTDGRRIYFTVDSRLSDIWVMDVRNQR
jgi:TolB protein